MKPSWSIFNCRQLIKFQLPLTVSTIGTEISRETLSKIVDEICDDVLAWQRRPLEAWQFLTIVANPGRMGLRCLVTRRTRCLPVSSVDTSN